MSARPGGGLRIGVVGTGALGFHHARLLRRMPGVAFAGIYDKNPARAADVAKQLETVAHPSLAALLEEVEAVTVAVPTPVHAEVGLAVVRDQQPDLVLMDIQLPGMDGLQAAAQLKADPATRAIPIIALTALAMKGDEERIRAAGCDGYIAKPLAYKNVLAVIDAHLLKSGFERTGTLS